MKRHPALTQLAQEHHHALVLAKTLAEDAPERLRANLPTDRAELVAHVQTRFAEELEPHFREEERDLLPRRKAHGGRLGELAARVENDHAKLRAAVNDLQPDPGLSSALDAFAQALEAHVRLEDREWFTEMEAAIPDFLDQLSPRT